MAHNLFKNNCFNRQSLSLAVLTFYINKQLFEQVLISWRIKKRKRKTMQAKYMQNFNKTFIMVIQHQQSLCAVSTIIQVGVTIQTNSRLVGVANIQQSFVRLTFFLIKDFSLTPTLRLVWHRRPSYQCGAFLRTSKYLLLSTAALNRKRHSNGGGAQTSKYGFFCSVRIYLKHYHTAFITI